MTLLEPASSSVFPHVTQTRSLVSVIPLPAHEIILPHALFKCSPDRTAMRAALLDGRAADPYNPGPSLLAV